MASWRVMRMPEFITLKQYIAALGHELKDADPYLRVEAQDDAEEAIEETMGDLFESGAVKDEAKALQKAIRQFGSPKSVAREYLRRADDDERISDDKMDTALGGIFGVYLHKETYLGLLYLLLMLPLGIVLFSYVITGLSVGIGLAITVIGIPILILFLISIYGIGYLMGRLTELMLGIRMPRRRRKTYLVGSAWARLKRILSTPRVYSSLLYMVLLLPLGIFYFVTLVIWLSLSLFLITLPLSFLIPGSYDIGIFLSWGLAGTVVSFIGFLTGIVMLTWTLHLSNIMCYIHGKLSSLMLMKR
jgi:uncharacterized membrane protein